MNTEPNLHRPTPYAALVAVVAVGALTMPLSVSPGAPVHSAEHNARVAEYLLRQPAAHPEHNARVAEYLLHRGAAPVHNARIAETLGE